MRDPGGASSSTQAPPSASGPSALEDAARAILKESVTAVLAIGAFAAVTALSWRLASLPLPSVSPPGVTAEQALELSRQHTENVRSALAGLMGVFTLLVGYYAGRTPAEAAAKSAQVTAAASERRAAEAEKRTSESAGELERRAAELQKRDQALIETRSTLVALKEHVEASQGGIQLQNLPRFNLGRIDSAVSLVDGVLARGGLG